MHYFDIYLNGKFYDTIYFATRRTIESVKKYAMENLRLNGKISVQESPDFN